MSHFAVCVFTKTGSEDEVAKLLAPYQENNMGDCPKEFLVFEEDEDGGFDPELKKHGYWENPNAKWDYWNVGGRYSGLLRLKNGSESNSAPIKNIDPNPTAEEIRKKKRFWEIVVEGQELMEGEEKLFKFYKPEYFLEQYGTKENYVKATTGLTCWAFVDNDGWREQGELGWFCASDATKESRDLFRENFCKALENGDPESYITVVDCHI